MGTEYDGDETLALEARKVEVGKRLKGFKAGGGGRVGETTLSKYWVGELVGSIDTAVGRASKNGHKTAMVVQFAARR